MVRHRDDEDGNGDTCLDQWPDANPMCPLVVRSLSGLPQLLLHVGLLTRALELPVSARGYSQDVAYDLLTDTLYLTCQAGVVLAFDDASLINVNR
jgi:hypothetical protein